MSVFLVRCQFFAGSAGRLRPRVLISFSASFPFFHRFRPRFLMRPALLPRSSAFPCARPASTVFSVSMRPARFHGPRPHFLMRPARFHGLQRFHAPDPLSRPPASLPCARPCFHGLQRFHASDPLSRPPASLPCARPCFHDLRLTSLCARPAFTAPRPTSMCPGPFPRPPAHSLRPPVKKMLKIYSVRASPSPLCAFFSLDNASGSPRSIRFSKS